MKEKERGKLALSFIEGKQEGVLESRHDGETGLTRQGNEVKPGMTLLEALKQCGIVPESVITTGGLVRSVQVLSALSHSTQALRYHNETISLFRPNHGCLRDRPRCQQHRLLCQDR
jgi:hypothetical protein